MGSVQNVGPEKTDQVMETGKPAEALEATYQAGPTVEVGLACAESPSVVPLAREEPLSESNSVPVRQSQEPIYGPPVRIPVGLSEEEFFGPGSIGPDWSWTWWDRDPNAGEDIFTPVRDVFPSVPISTREETDLDELHSSMHWKVGDGKSALFWKDSWCGDGPFMYRFPDLYRIAEEKNCSVAHHWEAHEARA
ncbi:hypothetical protein QJS10_CPA09g00691 [Acorus calamus]|uniref:Uncharacterized protein n=1 Tax=Acorus calamus TaxID=4465 RepID=A0AAV9E8S9_ACOCL|nr:hypothetical protein QJS10_CPA09g00691 [Acorus calamus]